LGKREENEREREREIKREEENERIHKLPFCSGNKKMMPEPMTIIKAPITKNGKL
jgi:hypothetical protein